MENIEGNRLSNTVSIVIILLLFACILYFVFYLMPEKERKFEETEAKIMELSRKFGCNVLFLESIRNNSQAIVPKIYCLDGRIGFADPEGRIMRFTEK